LSRIASALGINLAIKRNAETLVLNPSDAATQGTNIAHFNLKSMTALHLNGALSHHAPVREITHAHPVDIRLILDPNIGK
jgi:hypothetical protein